MALRAKKRYPSDLTREQYKVLEGLISWQPAKGRKKAHTLLEILNALLYVVVSGCQWRMLPKDFPPWKTVYHYFRLWTLDGTIQTIHNTVRGRLREKLGRDSEPSALIVDSQSVKTSVKGGIVDMMQARKPRDENAMLRLTRKG
jgi:putative transposase